MLGCARMGAGARGEWIPDRLTLRPRGRRCVVDGFVAVLAGCWLRSCSAASETGRDWVEGSDRVSPGDSRWDDGSLIDEAGDWGAMGVPGILDCEGV